MKTFWDIRCALVEEMGEAKKDIRLDLNEEFTFVSGWLSADHLRKIASAMDEMKAVRAAEEKLARKKREARRAHPAR